MKKKIILKSVALTLLFLVCTITGFSGTVVFASVNYLRVTDKACVLTSEEKSRLTNMLDEMSKELCCDVIIVTENTLNGKNIQIYADDYYDYNGYGYGENADGVLFLMVLQERSFAISTCGTAYEAMGDAEINTIKKEVRQYLSDGEYYNAFVSFAENSKKYISENQYQSNGDKINLGKTAIISVVMGTVCGFVAVTVMKGKLKSVRQKNQAKDYVLENSFNLTCQRDMYLYKTVNRVARPKENSSSHGRGHISSSGRTHGGGSGRF